MANLVVEFACDKVNRNRTDETIMTAIQNAGISIDPDSFREEILGRSIKDTINIGQRVGHLQLETYRYRWTIQDPTDKAMLESLKRELSGVEVHSVILEE